MSVEAIVSREPAAAHPTLDLSSPLFTVVVGALVPLFKFLQIARDMLARKEITPACCLDFIPDLMLLAAVWGAYTPIIFWLGRRFPPWHFRYVLLHLGAVVALAMPGELYWWFFASPEMHNPPPDPFLRYVLFRFANALAAYALILAAGVLRDRYVEQSRYARLTLRLERHLADVELAALRTQLDPELVNVTLATIEEACRNDDERAERLVVALADFLRLSLEQIDRRDVSLARELSRLERLTIVLSELGDRRIAVDIEVADADRRRLTGPPAMCAVVRELLGGTAGDATLRVRLEGDLVVSVETPAGAATQRFELRDVASERLPESMPPAPDASPLPIRGGVAAGLLVVASVFGRAVTETGTNESFLSFAYWTGIGTLITVPACFVSVYAARRVARSRRVALAVLAVFAGTFAAAYLSELSFALVRPRWGELNAQAAMSGFLATVARSRAVAFHHLLFVMAAFFAIAVRYDERARDVLALHAGVREAQLRKLRAQLRPHFLFNSLNSILGRLGGDRESAAGMAASLRRFLHTTFMLEPRSSVPLHEELDAVREYLEIERNRVGSRMRVDWQIDDDTRDVRIPALLLQPLVENAVQHGVSNVSRPVRIVISASRAGRSLSLAVEDDGSGAAARRGRGLGLATTHGLLAAFYGGEAVLVAAPRAPNGFAVRMSLPL